MAEYDGEPHDGVQRMLGLIAQLKVASKLTDPDSITPTASRGAQAVWGRKICIFMELGMMASDIGACKVYVIVTIGGRRIGPELSFDVATLSGHYGQVLTMINDVMPKIEEERRAFETEFAEVEKEAAEVMAQMGDPAYPPVDENPFLTALRQLSPQDKATALSILEGA